MSAYACIHEEIAGQYVVSDALLRMKWPLYNIEGSGMFPASQLRQFPPDNQEKSVKNRETDNSSVKQTCAMARERV